MLGKERDQVGRKGPYFRAQRVFLKIKEYNRYNSDESHTTHTHTSPFLELCYLQESTVQGWIWMQQSRSGGSEMLTEWKSKSVTD